MFAVAVADEALIFTTIFLASVFGLYWMACIPSEDKHDGALALESIRIAMQLVHLIDWWVWVDKLEANPA